MILSTGVQLPNVLTESIPNSNLESEQFFSKFIEDIIKDYEKRHPSDHYAALKQWKQKHVIIPKKDRCMSEVFLCLDKDEDFPTPRRMNGFETLIDVVQRKHLGKIQRYFLNLSPNRHFNPYDLVTVSEYQVLISAFRSFENTESSLQTKGRCRKPLCLFCVWNFKHSSEWS